MQRHEGIMSVPLSARTNAAATAAAVNMMPGGIPRRGTPNNPLLVKDEVGKAKASCYDLPHERFAYGRPGNHDSEGAREVSMHWVSHKPSRQPESTAPDFVWFNKRAASAKVTTARDLAFYRKEHDSFTPRYGDSARGAPSRVIPSDVMTSYTYGKKVRPSTPIDDVMSHRFAEAAEDDLRKFYTDYRDELDNDSRKVRKIPMTTASRGHALRAREEKQWGEETTQDMFKLSKFRTRATTKINNGRQKAAHTALLAQLIKDAERPSDLGQEASDGGDPFDGDTAPATPPRAGRLV